MQTGTPPRGTTRSHARRRGPARPNAWHPASSGRRTQHTCPAQQRGPAGLVQRSGRHRCGTRRCTAHETGPARALPRARRSRRAARCSIPVPRRAAVRASRAVEMRDLHAGRARRRPCGRQRSPRPHDPRRPTTRVPAPAARSARATAPAIRQTRFRRTRFPARSGPVAPQGRLDIRRWASCFCVLLPSWRTSSRMLRAPSGSPMSM